MTLKIAVPLSDEICENQPVVMNVTLAPGASLRRVAEIVRNAVSRGPGAWEGGSLPERIVNANRPENLLPTDRDAGGAGSA